MNNNQARRLWIVTIGIVLFSIILIARLVKFQVLDGPSLAERGSSQYVVNYTPARGIVLDRHGAVLAANGADYRISATPNMVVEPEKLAAALAPILQEQVYQLKAKLQSNRPYVLLEGRVSKEIAERISEIPYEGLQIEPLPRRFYPQGKLMSHTLGYVNFEGEGRTGIEGYYNQELAGEAASQIMNLSPLILSPEVNARPGVDLVLTIDRSVQFTVEEHLRAAIRNYDAEGGSIIVLDPKTGAILAMASEPTYDPYNYYKENPEELQNPIVSKQFEPGSVIKLITMAAALDAGVVTPESTYYDNGELFVGGHKTVNWTREAHGTVDMLSLIHI